MTSENALNIERAILVTLPPDSVQDEVTLRSLANRFRLALPVSDEEFEVLLKRLHSRLQIKMDLGSKLVEKDHVPWLNSRKAEIEPAYWDRYQIFLGRREWPPSVVSSLERVTDEILDSLGNPVTEGPWRRKGLVIGEVQSGKTATYTALCCKSADAGYRLVILLTGTLENLRRQTQERLDEGFVGVDSSGVLSKNRSKRYLGVGEINPNLGVGVFTSRSTDFRSALVNSLGFKLNSFNAPILLVLKKNYRILQNLEDWLKAFNLDQDGSIASPMLLIDDEADNASINTSADPEAPTKINERIRSLLKLFSRSSYVGFTATPFANIFINPETDDEMRGDDLFPRDFLYVLDPPTNYLGPQSIFADPARLECLRSISDGEQSFPARHKSSLQVTELPKTLRVALRLFLVANVIRDLRGEGPTHRSMLVNVSRFTDVQETVATLIDQELKDLQASIRNYSKLSPEDALRKPSIRQLKEAWELEFKEAGYSWAEIQNALREAALPIVVKAVNQRTGAASLDYAVNSEAGLRVVAVGGNSLSRGLTLEGLTISYFYRNSMMYDTLLQMGRWFGYRDGYEDLCRIWLSEEAMSWYRHITESAEELRQEVRRMRGLGLTPRDFGLKVRSHPDSLLVTARNKMRNSQEIVRTISVSGQGIEATMLRTSSETLEGNNKAVADFFEEMRAAGIAREISPLGNSLWRNVPASIAANLIRRFEAHPLNTTFQGKDLAQFLEGTTIGRLKTWDVLVPNGGEASKNYWGFDFRPQERNVKFDPETLAILVGGDKRRVSAPGIEREGLTDEQILKATEAAKHAAQSAAEEALSSGKPIKKPWDSKSRVADKYFRRYRDRPLLLIHVLEPFERMEEPAGPGKEPTVKKGICLKVGRPVVALGLSFPMFDDGDQAKKVKYRVNLVELRSLFETEDDDNDDPVGPD